MVTGFGDMLGYDVVAALDVDQVLVRAVLVRVQLDRRVASRWLDDLAAVVVVYSVVHRHDLLLPIDLADAHTRIGILHE